MELYKSLTNSTSLEQGVDILHKYLLEEYNINILKLYILIKNSFLSPILIKGSTLKLGHLSLTEDSLIVRSYLNNREIVVTPDDEDYSKNKLLKSNNINFFLSVPFPNGVITAEATDKVKVSLSSLVETIKISGHILFNMFFKKSIFEYEIQEYLAKVKKEAEISSKLAVLGKISSSIVHEIKNPLTTINVLINQLIIENNNNQLSHDLRVIKEEVERINRLLKEFLLFARPAKPNKENIVIDDFMNDIRLIVRQYLRERNISLNVKNSIRTMKVDKDQLKQILLNLILNSIEAIQNDGKINIYFEKRLYSDKEYNVVIVEDNGPGIEESKIPYIFEPFFSENSNGTGLGLSIVKTLVNNNEGIIEFYNLLHGGACFTIYFPLE